MIKIVLITTLCVVTALMLAFGYEHRRPVSVINDTAKSVQLDFERFKIFEAPPFQELEPADHYSVPGCRKNWEFVYLSTISHPRAVAYRVRDLCDLDVCGCEIEVSQLEAHRKDLAVPWQQAGIVLPPGAR